MPSKRNRPKWAKALSAKTWKHLMEAQHTSRPTLRQLREDVEHQSKRNVTCWDCKLALRAVEADQRGMWLIPEDSLTKIIRPKMGAPKKEEKER